MSEGHLDGVLTSYLVYSAPLKDNPKLSQEQATKDKGYPHPGSSVKLPYGEIWMQYGAAPGDERNGNLMTEVLDAIIDHLEVYQDPSSPMRSRETACAITKLQEARMWLDQRQRDRARRSVRFTDEA